MSSFLKQVLAVEDIFCNLPALETQRLILRRLEPGDLEDVYEYARNPEVARYTSWDPHRSIDDSRFFLKSVFNLYRGGKVAPWGVYHRGDRKLIGTVGFTLWFPRFARAEIGYALSQAYWNQGLVTEAVGRVLAFGFKKMALNRIQAMCLIANIGSARVMEKAGMQFEGVLRAYVTQHGIPQDLKLYAITADDWSILSRSEEPGR